MSTISRACETVGDLRRALADITDDCTLLDATANDDRPLRVDIRFTVKPAPGNIQCVLIGPWPEDTDEDQL